MDPVRIIVLYLSSTCLSPKSYSDKGLIFAYYLADGGTGSNKIIPGERVADT